MAVLLQGRQGALQADVALWQFIVIVFAFVFEERYLYCCNAVEGPRGQTWVLLVATEPAVHGGTAVEYVRL